MWAAPRRELGGTQCVLAAAMRKVSAVPMALPGTSQMKASSSIPTFHE